MTHCTCQPKSQIEGVCLTCKQTLCSKCLSKQHQQHINLTIKHIQNQTRPISEIFYNQSLEYTKFKHQLVTYKREAQLSRLEQSNKAFLDNSQGLAQLTSTLILSMQGKLSCQSQQNIIKLVQRFGGQVNVSRYIQSINSNFFQFNKQVRQIISTMETRVLASNKVAVQVSSQNISPNNLIRQGPKSGCKKICIKFSACGKACCGLLTCQCIKCGCCKDACQFSCEGCCNCQNCCDCICNCLEGCCGDDDCCCIGSCCECLCQCLQGICECFAGLCQGIFSILTCSCDD